MARKQTPGRSKAKKPRRASGGKQVPNKVYIGLRQLRKMRRRRPPRTRI